MNKFAEANFNIPELEGISKKTMDEHLKLYAGYVKHTNLILDMIEKYQTNDEGGLYSLAEIQRRFSFEFDGMRNHEYYFRSLEGGVKPLPANSKLKVEVKKTFGSWDAMIAKMKELTTIRGIGWAMLYYDPLSKQLVTAWVDEQHLGQLNGLKLVFAIDMWEHSYYLDYGTEKKKYVDAFLANVNWEVVEKNFLEAEK